VAACDEPIKGLHVAWTPDLGYAVVEPEVQRLCENAAAEFESLGCHVEVVSPGWENPEEAFSTLVAAQFYAHWSDQLPAAESALDPTLVSFIRRGGGITARNYVLAAERVKAYWSEVHAFLERFDLLLTPTVAVSPFPAGEPLPREIADQRVSPLGWMPFTYPFNLTGQPAASVPAGLTDDGRPVGLQVIGRRHADRAVLAASAAYEAACPWADRRPPA
jgi:aspartyl-tRNA(Asn)/glutamyl-tRNA(Gln) amidotransferase subunit A